MIGVEGETVRWYQDMTVQRVITTTFIRLVYKLTYVFQMACTLTPANKCKPYTLVWEAVGHCHTLQSHTTLLY